MATIKDVFVPSSYQTYIDAVKEEDLLIALKKSTKRGKALLGSISEKKSKYAYAEDKWTLKELLQHMIDAERVFVYRALRFARKDHTPLPGFDENTWAPNSRANERKWKEMLKEFMVLRESTIRFFESLGEDQLNQRGISNNNEINVIGIGFVCAGHLTHHLKIIRQRYLKSGK